MDLATAGKLIEGDFYNKDRWQIPESTKEGKKAETLAD